MNQIKKLINKIKIMKTINTDEMYVIKQPNFASVSIISFEGINTKEPLPDDVHNMLDTLSEFSDLVFIFPRDIPQRLNVDKFSKLYKACSWIMIDENSPRTLINVFEYVREVFARHVQFNIAFAEDLERFKTPDKLKDVRTLQMQNPVLEIYRYNADVFFGIYNTPGNEGAYAAYYTPSPIIKLSPDTIDIFRGIDPDIIDSFAKFSRDFIPSMIKWLGIEYTDKDVQEL